MTATATKDQDQSQLPADALKPVSYEQWQRERAELKQQLEKARPRLNKCLSAASAAQYEARKPAWTWRVEASYMRQDGKGRLTEEKYSREVVAQNEQDAWAIFCDAIEDWPSPHRCETKITNLGKPVNAQGDD